jgi:hypothetical protein
MVAPGMVNFSRIRTKWMIATTIPTYLSENEHRDFETAFSHNINNVNLENYFIT